jgi:hypothetical protein
MVFPNLREALELPPDLKGEEVILGIVSLFFIYMYRSGLSKFISIETADFLTELKQVIEPKQASM